MKKWILLLMFPLMLSLAGCGLFGESEKSKEEPKDEPVAEEKDKDQVEEVKEEPEEEVVEEPAEEETDKEDTVTAPSGGSLENKEQVQEYVNQIRTAYLEIAELGGRWDELRNASANQQITDYEFADYIALEILPWNMILIEELEYIIPPNEEIVIIHEMIIDAINKQHIAFSEIMDAVNTGDYTKITKANEILSEVRKLDREFNRQMEVLIDKYGVN